MTGMNQGADSLEPQQLFLEHDDHLQTWKPTQIGPYRIERELGRGGMGVVFLASRDDKEFRKQVAIKILQGHLVNEQMRRRFRFERQTLANLEHPNIARLLDGGTTEHGEPYLVMEYVRGALSITRYCEEQNLKVNERIRLFRDAVTAVQYAHSHLVVHRDLKPNNILVTPEGVVKLVDFGIAKTLMPGFYPDEEALTMTGTHAMTPEYASPEQVRGEPIGTGSDVYSLGVILYVLLTGELPFGKRDKGMPELIREICEAEPRKPSTRIARASALRARTEEHTTEETEDPALVKSEGRARLARILAGDLDNIILMALRKDPMRRYNSAEQFSEDLGRYLDGMPVIARKDTFHYRASKFVGRNLGGVIAAALLVAAVAGGIVSTIRQSHRAEEERARATASALEANQQKQRAEEMARLASQNQLRAEQMAATAKAKADEAGRERLHAEERFKDVHKLATSFLFEFDRKVAPLAGSTPARQMVVQKALEYLEKLSVEGERDPIFFYDLAIAYYQIGLIQRARNLPNLGDSEGALKSHRRALEIAERSLALHGETTSGMRAKSVALSGIADVASLQGDTPRAIEGYEKALELAEKIARMEKKHFNIRRDPMRMHGRLADMRLELGQHERARLHLESALRTSEDMARDFTEAQVSRDLAVGYSALGRYHQNRRDFPNALARFEKALETSEGLLDKYPNNAQYQRDVMVMAAQLAGTWRAHNSLNQALPYAQRGFDISRGLHEADPKNLLALQDHAAAHVHLGEVLAGLGKLDDAARLLRAGVGLADTAGTFDPRSVPALAHRNMTRSALGSVLASLNDWQGAEQQFDNLLVISEASTRGNATPGLWRELAKRYVEAGDFHHRASKSIDPERHQKAARECYSKALEAYSRANDSSQRELLSRKLNEVTASLRQ
ncbi:MAG: protein kinase [Bryobacterales bacterium]|nr:protein kinase [Bryobacterales bacterium]